MEANISQELATEIIKKCQYEVEIAIQSGDVPMACILTDMEGNILATAHNTQNTDNDPTAHAEINALRQLGRSKSSRYLDGVVSFSNAASCSMCMSACVKAHIRNFYFGAVPEPSMDPWITMEDIAAKSKEKLFISGPISGEECAAQIARGRERLAKS